MVNLARLLERSANRLGREKSKGVAARSQVECTLCPTDSGLEASGGADLPTSDR